MTAQVNINISRIFKDTRYTKDQIDRAAFAGLFIVEQEYVDQAPGNDGKFKQGIKVRKIKPFDYVVESTARDAGENYPLYLYTGTGRLKGAPDYGFTTGRVRAGDVAFGIGGIRPNKAAKRAAKNSGKNYLDYVSRVLYKQLRK